MCFGFYDRKTVGKILFSMKGRGFEVFFLGFLGTLWNFFGVYRFFLGFFGIHLDIFERVFCIVVFGEPSEVANESHLGGNEFLDVVWLAGFLCVMGFLGNSWIYFLLGIGVGMLWVIEFVLVFEKDVIVLWI